MDSGADTYNPNISDTSNATVLSRKKRQQAQHKQNKAEAPPPVSKSVLKKLAQITRAKASRKHRVESLGILQDHVFIGDKRVLLDSSGKLGTEQSKTEELARLYALQQGGVKLSDDDKERLHVALAEEGDFERVLEYMQSKHRNTLAAKQLTSNPFAPLNSSHASLTSIIHSSGANKKHSAKELREIAKDMKITDFDDTFKKKQKKRQRREHGKLLADADIGGDGDNTIVILPKELSELSSVIETASDGKIKTISSSISHAQAAPSSIPIGSSSSSSSSSASSTTGQSKKSSVFNETSLQMASTLLSKGLLTKKSKGAIDSIFDMDSFSSENDDSDDDDDDTNQSSRDEMSDHDEGATMWGVSTELSKKEHKEQQKQKQQGQQQPVHGTKKGQGKTVTSASERDVLLSAASSAQHKAGADDIHDTTDEQQHSVQYKASLPQSLAMPSIFRTNKAAVAMRHNNLPVVSIGGTEQTSQTPIISKKVSKRSKPTSFIHEDHDDNDNEDQEENPYAVKFQVLKSADVLDESRRTFDSDDDNSSDNSEDSDHSSSFVAPPLSTTLVRSDKPRRRVLLDLSVPAPNHQEPQQQKEHIEKEPEKKAREKHGVEPTQSKKQADTNKQRGSSKQPQRKRKQPSKE